VKRVDEETGCYIASVFDDDDETLHICMRVDVGVIVNVGVASVGRTAS
jgi:hypothetical protein